MRRRPGSGIMPNLRSSSTTGIAGASGNGALGTVML